MTAHDRTLIAHAQKPGHKLLLGSMRLAFVEAGAAHLSGEEAAFTGHDEELQAACERVAQEAIKLSALASTLAKQIAIHRRREPRA